MIKNTSRAVDSVSQRNNFTKQSPRNFHLQVNPFECGLGSVIDSAIEIVLSDVRYATLAKRLYSQTFLREFLDKSIAEHIATETCNRINLLKPECNAKWWVSVDRDYTDKFTIVIRTNPINI